MKIAIISARYTEQTNLELFLGHVFGYGQAMVKWKRGRFQCTLPRALTPAELDAFQTSVGFSHYAES